MLLVVSICCFSVCFPNAFKSAGCLPRCFVSKRSEFLSVDGSMVFYSKTLCWRLEASGRQAKKQIQKPGDLQLLLAIHSM